MRLRFLTTTLLGGALVAASLTAGTTLTVSTSTPAAQQLRAPAGAKIEPLDAKLRTPHCQDSAAKGKHVKICFNSRSLSAGELAARKSEKAARRPSAGPAMVPASYSAMASAAPTSLEPCDYADYYDSGAGLTYILDRIRTCTRAHLVGYIYLEPEHRLVGTVYLDVDFNSITNRLNRSSWNNNVWVYRGTNSSGVGASAGSIDISYLVQASGCTNAAPKTIASPALGSWSNATTMTTGCPGTALVSDIKHAPTLSYFVSATYSRATMTLGSGAHLRCDSSSYINGTSGGCVIPGFRPTLTVDRSAGSLEQAEAQHIYDAQNFPQTTVPATPNKVIPGKPGTTPLTRTTNATVMNANTSQAKKTCLATDPNYASKGLDCDEYPYKSTQEGAARGNGMYSARPVDATQNQKAGSNLSTFFSQWRVLDGDTFWVSAP